MSARSTGTVLGVTGAGRAPEWRGQAERVAAACTALVPGLLGVYVHGSAALGGFGPASDLDVLVVTDGDADWRALGARLLEDCGHPQALELSVVDVSACAHPSPPWRYHLHVNSGESRFGVGAGRSDPDLIAHYAVTRAAGVAITGPPGEAVFGPVARSHLLGYLREELRWSLENADQRYAVLNACRASAYAEEDRLLSKLDGGRWWLQRFGAESLVDEALAAQRQGRDLGASSPAARSFVDQCITRL